MEEKPLTYFRVKTEYVSEKPNGALEKRKVEELVLASCYTEAEMLANELVEVLQRSKFGSVSFDIAKTKISDVLFNEILAQEEGTQGFACNVFMEDENSGVGLYAVKVVFLYLDEKTAKEKQSTEVFYVPAESNADATSRIQEHLRDTTMDFVIRDTKFDKAEAIYWPFDVQKSKTERFKLG